MNIIFNFSGLNFKDQFFYGKKSGLR